MTRRAFGHAAVAGVLLLGAAPRTLWDRLFRSSPVPANHSPPFRNDQAICRRFADQAVRDRAQGANLRGLGTAALTTVLGAGLGAAIGGGKGAAVALPPGHWVAPGWERREAQTPRTRSSRCTTMPLSSVCIASATQYQAAARRWSNPKRPGNRPYADLLELRSRTELVTCQGLVPF
jgi:hypothetical protein